jgi:sugar O-acyltransferase (sialic acid O-acetyltransferase NeuD family)
MALEATAWWCSMRFDEPVDRIGRSILGCIVQRFDPDMRVAGERFHVSIGHNDARGRIFGALNAQGGSPVTIIHPAATVARSATIGGGTFVAARAIVAPVAVVGDGVIINHGSVIDHECVVGDFVIWPRARRWQGMSPSDRGFGAGANILPGIRIGDGATIGAGAVVTADISPGTTYAGVPARKVR